MTGASQEREPDLGARRGRRLTWLVVVPTALAFAPWVFTFTQQIDSLTVLFVAASMPVTGALCVVGYAYVTREYVDWLPFALFAITAVAFAWSTTDFALAVQRDPDGSFLPYLPIASGFLQPWFALLGGVAGYVTTEHPAPRTR